MCIAGIHAQIDPPLASWKWGRCKCKQECIPVGCVPSTAVAVSGGVFPGVLPRGVCLGGVCLGGCMPKGVCLSMGVCLLMGMSAWECAPSGSRGRHPLDPEADTPRTEWQTLMKTLPSTNTIADGKIIHPTLLTEIQQSNHQHRQTVYLFNIHNIAWNNNVQYWPRCYLKFLSVSEFSLTN